MYWRVPMTSPEFERLSRSAIFARPKSVTQMTSCRSSRRFAGLTSRWRTPCSCAYWRASAACTPIVATRRQWRSLKRTATAPLLVKGGLVVQVSGRDRPAPPPVEDDVEPPPVDQLHDDVVQSLELADPEDWHDVGMVQAGGRLRLVLEPPPAARVEERVPGQDLHGDATAERG